MTSHISLCDCSFLLCYHNHRLDDYEGLREVLVFKYERSEIFCRINCSTLNSGQIKLLRTKEIKICIVHSLHLSHFQIHELHDLKDTSSVITLDEERALEHMEWSEVVMDINWIFHYIFYLKTL